MDSFYDELEKIAKSGSAPKYKAPRYLRPGDIILTTMADYRPRADLGAAASAARRAFDLGYRAISPNLQGSYTHSMLYTGKGQVVEARINGGVKQKSFARATENKGYVVLRPKVKSSVRRKATTFAKRQVGKKYDTTGLGSTVTSLFLPDGVAKRLTPNKAIEKSDAFQCATLITAAYRKAGAPDISDVKWSATAPAHLLASSKTVRIGKNPKRRREHGPRLPGRFRRLVREKL